MPSTTESGLGDFFAKKPVKKKKKQGGTAKDSVDEPSESTPQEDAVPEQIEGKVENSTHAAESSEVVEETPMDESHENAQGEEEVALEEPAANDKKFDPEDGVAKTFAELIEKSKDVFTKEEILAYWHKEMYLVPDKLEKRLDPEDELTYTFQKLIEKNKGTDFTLMDLIAYWFDDMEVVPTDQESENVDEFKDGPCKAIPSLQVSAMNNSRLDFVLNTRDGVDIYGMDPGSDNPELVASFDAVQAADALNWSPDGRLLGLRGYKSLEVLDAAGGYKVLCELLPLGNEWTSGFKFHFSPLASYAVCFEPEATDHENNLRIWQLCEEPVLLGSFYHDRRSEAVWPYLKWTADEKTCCRMAKDELQIFPGDHFQKVSMAIPCEGVTAFEVSNNYVALFVPQRKKAKAKAFVYSFEDSSKPAAAHDLGQGSNVSIWWNHKGTAVLFLVSTDVDDTGESYYGKSTLFFISADGSDCHEVATDIHDVAWRPNQDEFLLLHGNFPCKITIHSGQEGSQELYYGTTRRNKIEWSPLGSFFILGGFGNLRGDIDFWDRLSSEHMGKTRYECCVACQWSANGRYVLGCTTSPRMRVDNRIEIFDYVGNPIYVLKSKELYDASWRPMPNVFEDRPRTPGRTCNASAQVEKDNAKAKAYVPRNSDGKFAASLRDYDAEETLTTGMTTEEIEAREEAIQEAERAKIEAEREAKEELKRAKQERNAAFQEAISTSNQHKEKTRKIFVPHDLVHRIIGKKGTSIKELQDECGLKIEVNTPEPPPGEEPTAWLTVGPARHAWAADELDRAEEIVQKRVEEYRQEQSDEAGKGAGKKGKRDRTGTKELHVPAELVGGIIGSKGSTIEELKNKAGIYLKVVVGDSGPGTVVIGPGDDDTMKYAEELVLAKLEELRTGKSGGAKGKSKDGKGKGDADDRWGESKDDKGKGKGKDGSRRKGDKGDDWSDKGGKNKKGKDEWNDKGGKNKNRIEPYEPLKDEDFGPTLGEAFGKKSKAPVPEGGAWGNERQDWGKPAAVVEKKPEVADESQVKKQWMADTPIVKGKWADQEDDDPPFAEVESPWQKPKGKGKGDQAVEESRESKLVREKGNEKSGGYEKHWGAENGGRDTKSWGGYDKGGRSEQSWDDGHHDSKSRGERSGYGKGSGSDKGSRSDQTWDDSRGSDRGWGWESDNRDAKARGGDRGGYDKNSRSDGNRDKSKGSEKGGYEKSKKNERSWDDSRDTKGRGGRGGYDKSGGWVADDDTRDDRSRGNDRGYEKDRGWNDKSNGWKSSKDDWYQEEPVPKGQRHKSGSSQVEVAESQREPASASTSARASASDNNDSSRLKEQAQAAFMKGDFKVALDMYTKCLRGNPRDAHLLVERAKCYMKLNDPYKACMDCNSACKIAPEWREAFEQKSICQKANGLHDEAAATWKLAERLKASPPASSSENLNSWQGPEAEEDGGRQYSCGDCGEAADIGAIDETDGVWYCKACWEALEQPKETKAPKESSRPKQAHGQQRPASERQQSDRSRDKGYQKEKSSDRRQGNDRKPPSESHRPQQSERQEASTSEPAVSITMPKNPFGAALPRKTPS